MKRSALFSCLFLLGSVTAANAASLVITTDKLTYQIGEIINVLVSGDAFTTGASDSEIFGRLLFPEDSASIVSTSQSAHTSQSGGVTWSLGALDTGPGFITMFNQICCASAMTVDQDTVSMAVLNAEATGAVELVWETDPGNGALDYFGMTNQPGHTFTIVPEPTAGTLLALGLAGLSCARRPAGTRRCRSGMHG